MNASLANLEIAPALSAPAAPRISVVILAAGLSTRMGERAKLLLDVGGMPMIRRTVMNVLDFAPAEALVVTGYRADEVAQALAGLPVRCVINPDYAQGQPTSVATGVRALSAPCDAVMVMLGDQPLVTADHLRRLSSAYAQLDRESIVVPFYENKRGNPVLFATRHIPAIVSRALKPDGRRLIEMHQPDVCRAQFDSDVYVFDCDTPEDYERLLRRFEQAP